MDEDATRDRRRRREGRRGHSRTQEVGGIYRSTLSPLSRLPSVSSILPQHPLVPTPPKKSVQIHLELQKRIHGCVSSHVQFARNGESFEFCLFPPPPFAGISPLSPLFSFNSLALSFARRRRRTESQAECLMKREGPSQSSSAQSVGGGFAEQVH